MLLYPTRRDKPLEAFSPAILSGHGASLSSSHIGSKKEANDILGLAVEKGVRFLSFSFVRGRASNLRQLTLVDLSLGHDMEGGDPDEGCWEGRAGGQGQQGEVPVCAQGRHLAGERTTSPANAKLADIFGEAAMQRRETNLMQSEHVSLSGQM